MSKASLRRFQLLLAVAGAVAAAWPGRAWSQSFLFQNFEQGVPLTRSDSGWIVTEIDGNPGRSTNAFASQPTFDDNVKASRAAPAGFQMPLGGDFLDTPYPVQKNGTYWIGTFENRPSAGIPWGQTQGDNPTGIAYSPGFDIGGNAPRYVTFLIGGGSTSRPDLEKVEMVTPPPSTSCTGCETQWAQCCASTPARPWQVVSVRDMVSGNMRPAQASGQNREQMTRVVWDTYVGPLGSPRLPMRVRVRITDADSGAWGHINADDFEQVPTVTLVSQPTAADDPLWGYADLHTHWMSTLAFGAMRPVDYPAWPNHQYLAADRPYVWGAPWAPAPPGVAFPTGGQFAAALPACDGTLHQQPNGMQRTNPLFERLLAESNSGTEPDGKIHDIGNPPPVGEHNATCSIPTDCNHSRVGVESGALHRNSIPFEDLIHQQMYWEWVHRAWQGGLRLMVVDATNSVAIEGAASNLTVIPGSPKSTSCMDGSGTCDGAFATATDDRVTIARQVLAMKAFVLEPDIAAFAEIAYNPTGARDIVSRGKLAIVLGAEVDGLGALRGFNDVEDEVAALSAIGIRKLIPIHVVDNGLGGSAVYGNLFNAANDYLNGGGDCVTRDSFAAHPDLAWMGNPALGTISCPGVMNRRDFGDVDLNTPAAFTTPVFFDVENGCATRDGDGFCVKFMLGVHANGHGNVAFDTLTRIFIDHSGLLSTNQGFLTHPVDIVVARWPSSYGIGPADVGEVNTRGVTSPFYFEAMMDRSLIIDVEHMGEASLKDVIGNLGHRGLLWSSASCSNTPLDPLCQGDAYPVISSHTGFRQTSLLAVNTNDIGKWASERSKSPSDIDRIVASGGIIGVGTGFQEAQTATTPGFTSPVPNDCAGSSKSWVQSYEYLRQRQVLDNLPQRGIAIGSDMNGFAAQVGPRYGNHSCWATVNDSLRKDLWSPQSKLQTDNYHNGVFYNDLSGTLFFTIARSVLTQPPLQKMIILLDGEGHNDNQSDFNTQGLANYGLLPDFLQDVVNVADATPLGRAQMQADLQPLYRSAEDFIGMWSKAVRVCKTVRASKNCLIDSSPTSDSPADVLTPADPWALP